MLEPDLTQPPTIAEVSRAASNMALTACRLLATAIECEDKTFLALALNELVCAGVFASEALRYA